MNEHFLTEIEIKQFKCFTDFIATGFKRVNLIGGKNNIGKTAFIEACLINVSSRNINAMIMAIFNIKYKRENLNLINTAINFQNLNLINTTGHYQNFLDATRNYSATSNLGNTEFSIIEKDATKIYQLKINGHSKTINANELSIIPEPDSTINFIDNFGWCNDDLTEAYQAIQQQDQEDNLNAFIREFDDSIESFKIIGNKPQCKTKGEYRDIVEFGDGLRHYISIICALYACKNGYLFVDEIDNGVHYTQLDRLWELILTLSKKTNSQVFAVTHSKEMLESFARVAKKLDEQDISYTTLVKNNQQEIKAITHDYEMLLDSIEQEREIRGW
ncbi:MAG: AAA family ATPase [Methylococcales bacterium]